MFAQGNKILINKILEYEIERSKPLFDKFDENELKIIYSAKITHKIFSKISRENRMGQSET
jgi:hypothetical protein